MPGEPKYTDAGSWTVDILYIGPLLGRQNQPVAVVYTILCSTTVLFAAKCFSRWLWGPVFGKKAGVYVATIRICSALECVLYYYLNVCSTHHVWCACVVVVHHYIYIYIYNYFLDLSSGKITR